MLCFIEGPKLPKTLVGHSSLTLGIELIVLGGQSDTDSDHYLQSASVYKLSCDNGIFSNWIEMEVELKTPRAWFVASFIPNNSIYPQSTP